MRYCKLREVSPTYSLFHKHVTLQTTWIGCWFRSLSLRGVIFFQIPLRCGWLNRDERLILCFYPAMDAAWSLTPLVQGI